ncbi:MAG: response regulator transcription factor [Pseudomonadota bacterium]
MSTNILLVEDDENLRLTLQDNLEENDWQTQAVETGYEALAACEKTEFHLIILDIMLPDIDGYQVCRKLRENGCRAMILMLTARTLEEDLVRGFEAGADDYLAKPYRLKELLMRIKALLRRSGSTGTAEENTSFQGITLDHRARKVIDAQGQPVELTPKEFDLLAFFLARPNQALSRDAILDAVWGKGVIVDVRTVDNFVSNIKKKLNLQENIKTVRGVGYRLD